MGLMPARDTHRILDPSLQEEVERPFSSERFSGGQEKDHATPRIFAQVFKAFLNSGPDMAILKLPDGIVPFTIPAAPSNQSVSFAQVVQPRPAITNQARHFLCGEGAAVGLLQAIPAQSRPFEWMRLRFLIGYFLGRQRGV